jgi:hypothetical protein
MGCISKSTAKPSSFNDSSSTGRDHHSAAMNKPMSKEDFVAEQIIICKTTHLKKPIQKPPDATLHQTAHHTATN